MANTQYAFGIDVGGTTVKEGLFSVEGELLESWEIKTRSEDNGRNVLPDIAASILAKMEEKKIATEDVVGVGIGVPGPVLPGGVVNGCVNLGWGVVNVADDLSKALGGVRVEVGNDANVAALGEQWKGAGQGYDDMLMVTLGTGVGGGLILNVRIWGGKHGAGAEIGHIQIEKNETDVCGCGKKGCLEQYTSANGITRVAHKYMKKVNKQTILKDDDTLNAKKIFDAAKEGDEVALKLVDSLGERLGGALAAIAAVVDPEAFVIGGGVSKAGTILTDAIEKYYGPAAFHACRTAVIKLATLGNDAGMYGAVRMVLQ